ncbi:hypothetical protein CBM2634_A80249 [Cupriavidus taiwanensis]|uniref:Uncharacterized protein n=2 Tax=Cupriavidus taiwanensis TaxID=164546 RepID=A0A375J2H9_9BURK|nr:hypothetical protein CBM2634_A80249 [Cupriavidus taiwanensis]
MVHYLDGDREPLAELLAGGTPMPAEVRHFLALVISGEVSLGSRRGKNSKLTWREKDTIREAFFTVYKYTELVLIFLEQLASEARMEPIYLRRKMEKVREDANAKVAAAVGRCANTIRQDPYANYIRQAKDWARFEAGIYDIKDESGTYVIPVTDLTPDERAAFALEQARAYLANPGLFAPDLMV